MEDAGHADDDLMIAFIRVQQIPDLVAEMSDYRQLLISQYKNK
jgi:hypothetical protein